MVLFCVFLCSAVVSLVVMTSPSGTQWQIQRFERIGWFRDSGVNPPVGSGGVSKRNPAENGALVME